ncbi:uncharacterized protein BDR25DRAFT_397207 [Lindgomyces ingoldianus]|uniref:Uncharacterized protein n=1 Tax=Lindgomyces ingoldianus TaxID=673940 RepID=A0ACB6QB41_9PLEO|nr:uncharacterized protein BDR25DRAFT_397207 [Lindgomyces ingoldianus]KAF2463370.1 hypothetical protein BDR25DRAFT_397207 [Lindgomyces ingoldianus]
MEPPSNPAFLNAKYPALSPTTRTRFEEALIESSIPPPSYNMVVDPHDPIPNLSNPYDPGEDKDEDDEDEESDIPDITINAATQIRGHGNIISMPPMDSAKIAGMLYTMLNGCPPPQPRPQPQSHAQGPLAQGQASSASNANTQSPGQTRQTFSLGKPFQKINITVNCGATIIGDRNIVGPGLGEIARQISTGNRNPGQAAPLPPSSRTSSLEGENTGIRAKRKAEGDADGAPGAKKGNSSE